MSKKFQLLVEREPEKGRKLKNGNKMDTVKHSLRWFEYPGFNSMSDDGKKKIVQGEFRKVDLSDKKIKLKDEEDVIVTEQGRHNFHNPRFQGRVRTFRGDG